MVRNVTVAWGTGQIHCSAADPDTSYLVGCQQRGKPQGSATVNREQTVLRRRASSEAAAHRFSVLSMEDGGDCCNRKQEHRETSGEPPSVICAGLNSADGHGIGKSCAVGVPLVCTVAVLVQVSTERQINTAIVPDIGANGTLILCSAF